MPLPEDAAAAAPHAQQEPPGVSSPRRARAAGGKASDAELEAWMARMGGLGGAAQRTMARIHAAARAKEQALQEKAGRRGKLAHATTSAMDAELARLQVRAEQPVPARCSFCVGA